MQNILNENRLIELAEKIRNADNTLILLDFDGTLVDFTIEIANSIPSPELLNLLHKVADRPDNELIIITGRRQDEISSLVGHLPIGIIAEHGAMIRENSIWRPLFDGSTDWKNDVLQICRNFAAASPDSFIEEKTFSLAWHYRNVEQQTGTINSRKLIKALKEIALRYNLKIIDGKKVVEIISKNINKGTATRYLLGKKNYDYILSIGDDKTDEDMFRVLVKYQNAYTVKIGHEDTCARFKVHNIRQVIMLLEQLVTEAG